MYAGYEYYSGTYGGTIPEPDILPRLRQAARDVDTLTFGRIHAVGLENLSAYQQEIIQECCCQLAEFAHENADVLESIVSGYSINGASLTLSGCSGNCQRHLPATGGVSESLSDRALLPERNEVA